MVDVPLKIIKPLHNTLLKAPATVNLQGQVVSHPEGNLFFKWYSSLFEPPASQSERTTLNQSTDNPLSFSTSLGLGSHVILFTAKDQVNDDLASIQAVQNAGMTGGAPQAGIEAPCVIHILAATILSPNNGATLNRQTLFLKAKAPLKWGRQIGSSNNYEPDPDYHKPEVNWLQYHWFFSPRGSPAGRRSWNFIAAINTLTFKPKGNNNSDGPSVEIRQNLRSRLDSGPYRLTLRVEDRTNPSQFHAASRNITLT